MFNCTFALFFVYNVVHCPQLPVSCIFTPHDSTMGTVGDCKFFVERFVNSSFDVIWGWGIVLRMLCLRLLGGNGSGCTSLDTIYAYVSYTFAYPMQPWYIALWLGVGVRVRPCHVVWWLGHSDDIPLAAWPGVYHSKVLQDKGIIDKGVIRSNVLQDKGIVWNYNSANTWKVSILEIF